MGLLVECPKCGKLNSEKTLKKNGGKCGVLYSRKKDEDIIPCGFPLGKHSKRIWWIEYRDHEGKLRREKIGPNKKAAEYRLN